MWDHVCILVKQNGICKVETQVAETPDAFHPTMGRA